MGEKVGAETIDLEWVQVHPTGLVKPDDPDAKVKFLAAEALRGVGGLIFDANGKRFANEVGRRDYVTGEMWKNKPPFRLTLNNAAATEMIWHAKHYTGRGVMKYYESGVALAQDIGIYEDGKGSRRWPLASIPLGQVLGRAEREDGQRQKVLCQRPSSRQGEDGAFLRRDHHPCDPLLHGRPPDHP